MITPDLINGSFEFLAGFMILNHCRVAIKDKHVAGVSILSTAFFSIWGIWNLWYYPHLNQMWSFYGGLLIVVANCYWVFLMLKYRE
jgi:hypothetical protein